MRGIESRVRWPRADSCRQPLKEHYWGWRSRLAAQFLGRNPTEQGLTPEEAYQVNRAYAEWNGYNNWQNDYPEDELQTYAIGGDAGLMYYFANRAKKVADEILLAA